MARASQKIPRQRFAGCPKRPRLGKAEAQVVLGDMLTHEEGCARDHKAAAKWYIAAAKQDLPAAQFALGDVYFQGRGIPREG